MFWCFQFGTKLRVLINDCSNYQALDLKAELSRATGGRLGPSPSVPAIVSSRLSLGGEKVRALPKKAPSRTDSKRDVREDEDALLEPALAASWVSLQRKASTYAALHSAGGTDETLESAETEEGASCCQKMKFYRS